MKATTLKLRGGQLVRLDPADHARLKAFEYRKAGDEIVRTLEAPDDQGRSVRTLKHDVLERSDVAIRNVSGNLLDHRRANLEVVRDPKTSHIAKFEELRAARPARPAPRSLPPSKRHSPVMGVTFRKDRAASKPWRVRVQIDGTALYLGHYATRDEAEQVARTAHGQ